VIRSASKEEVSNWNKLIMNNPGGGQLEQSYDWTQFKKSSGWESLYLIYTYENVNYYFSILFKKSKLVGNTYVCPKGPGLYDYQADSDVNLGIIKKFTEEIKDYILAIDNRSAVLRINPRYLVKSIDLKEVGWEPNDVGNVYDSTIFLDISLPEDELLASLKQKTRYNIRLASKKGVDVNRLPPDEANLEVMYELMLATQKRSYYFLRKKEYYFEYWKKLIDAGLGALIITKYDGEPIAGAFISIFGNHAVYQDGGSYAVHRNKMAPYLLQWEAIKWAKEQGATEYDLDGSPPSNQLDGQHHYHNLYVFKKNFSPDVTDFYGYHYIKLDKRWYNRHKRMWRLYNSVYIRFKKNIYY